MRLIDADVVKKLYKAECMGDCGYFGEHLTSGYHACELYELPFCKPDDFCSHGERVAKGGV